MTMTIFFGYKLFKNRISSTTLPELDEDNLIRLSNLRAITYMALGLALLVLSADAMVEAASAIALDHVCLSEQVQLVKAALPPPEVAPEG